MNNICWNQMRAVWERSRDYVLRHARYAACRLVLVEDANALLGNYLPKQAIVYQANKISLHDVMLASEDGGCG